MEATSPVTHADAGADAIRALIHATREDVPAPLAYDLLSRLAEMAYGMDQLSRQIARGLLDSLHTYHVYDSNRDPEISYAIANVALLQTSQHVAAAAVKFTEAQAAISGQGNDGRRNEGGQS